MKKNTSKIVISIIGIVSISILFFARTKPTSATPSNSRNEYIKNIVGSLTISQGNKQQLLKKYCEGLNLSSIQNGLIEGSMYFTPKYSLFIGALCAPFAESDNKLQPFENADELLKKNFTWNGFLGSIPNGCDPSSDMKACDFSILLPQIFSRVMNDHSILSIAGWTFGLDKQATSNEKIRAAFSNQYFGNIGKVCGKEEGDTYVGDKSSSSSKNALCSHPKTATYLDNYINKLKKQQNNLQSLEPTALQGKIDKKLCSPPGGDISKQASLLLCSYNNTVQLDPGPMQINVWYNELLFYKTLIAWLSIKLDDPNFGPVYVTQDQGERPNTITGSITAGGNNERLNLQREITLSQKALVLMKQHIYNFRATFPLHIGLLAYYEDVVALRKAIAKVYTPIHQLYYKLRNVQAK